MGSVSTVYDVQLVYNVRGDATPALAAMGNAAEKAEKETEKLKRSTDGLASQLKSLAAAAGGALLIHEGKKAFIDFNKEVENAKVNIAAVQRMFNQAPDMSSAMQSATEVFDRYQEAAKASTATTKEFLDMHLSLGPTFAKFGVGGRRIEDIVQGATVAAPILGERPETFAMDVKQMLQGSVTLRDRSAVSLLSMLGIDREEFNRKTKEDIGFAIDTIQKALTSPAIMEARKVMENSFSGVTSTLVDTFEILAGEAGKGLFSAITEEVKGWNEWLTRNQYAVEKIKREVHDGLVTGFRTVKTFVGFVVEHKETLMAIAGAWAALKGVNLVGAGATGLGELVTTFSKINLEGKTVSQSFGDIAAKGASAAGSLGMLYVGLSAIASLIDAWHAKRVAGQSSVAAMESNIGIALGSKRGDRNTASGALVSQLKDAGVLTDAGTLDRAKFRAWAESQGEGSAAAIAMIGVVEKAMRVGNQVLNDTIGVKVTREAENKKVKSEKNPGVVVNINRVEVASDDPDRFVMGIVAIADRAEARAGQARSAIPSR